MASCSKLAALLVVGLLAGCSGPSRSDGPGRESQDDVDSTPAVTDVRVSIRTARDVLQDRFEFRIVVTAPDGATRQGLVGTDATQAALESIDQDGCQGLYATDDFHACGDDGTFHLPYVLFEAASVEGTWTVAVQRTRNDPVLAPAQSIPPCTVVYWTTAKGGHADNDGPDYGNGLAFGRLSLDWATATVIQSSDAADDCSN